MDGHRSYPDDRSAPWYPSGDPYAEAGWPTPPAEAGWPTPPGDPGEDRYQVPEPRASARDNRGAADARHGYTALPDPAPVDAFRTEALPADARQADPRQADAPQADMSGGSDPRPQAHMPRVVDTNPARPPGPGGPVPPPPPYGGPDADDPARFHTQPLDRSMLGWQAAPASGPGAPGPAVSGPPATDLSGKVYRTRRPAAAALIIVVTVLAEVVALRIFAGGVFGSTTSVPGAVAGLFLLVGLPLSAVGLYGLATGAAAAGRGGQPWLRTPLAYLLVGLVLLIGAGLAA